MDKDNTPKQILPIVRFHYPDSSDDKGVLKERYVHLTKMDEKYVEGYEVTAEDSLSLSKGILEHNTVIPDSSEGKFKRFCLSRIPPFGVALVRFK